MDFVRINGEMDERTLFETEERGVGVAVLPVLTDGITPGLAGHRILEFAGGYGYAVKRKYHVDGICLAWVTRHLPCYGERVAFESGEGIGVQAVGPVQSMRCGMFVRRTGSRDGVLRVHP